MTHDSTVSDFSVKVNYNIYYLLSDSVSHRILAQLKCYIPRLQNELDSDNAHSHCNELITVLGNVNINIWKQSVVS
jgi:hypothetical protein